MNFFSKRSAVGRVFFVLAALVVVSLFIATANAQSGTSSITGTVTDAQGQIVAGATVRLVNAEKGFSRTVTTTADGVFSFSSIQPDTYQIEVEAGGFKKYVQTNVQALVDRPIDLTLALEVGNVNETINITADTIESIVNTQDASLGNNFQPRQITQLPIESRNVPDLLSLQPGVTQDGSSTGARSDQSNITLDGVDVNDQQTGAAFSPVLRISAEAVEEFRVTTTNPNANQGRSSGAQISLITRSGTNRFRGALFEFHRPTKLSANDFFNNRAGRYTASDFAVQLGQAQVGQERVPRPNIIRNVFGGRLGGPIVKDKLFFFYSYEAFRERQSISVVRTVPLASLGRGEVRFRGSAPGDPAGTNRIVTINASQLNTIFPGTVVAGSAANPFTLSVLADAARRYPANDDSVGDGLNTGGFRFNAPVPDDQNTHIAKFDYNINNNQLLFVRGNYQQDSRQRASQFPDTPSPETWSHPIGLAVGHNWTISGNKVNNFRYGFTRQAFTSQGDSTQNAISFRFVFSPFAYSRTVSRVTPVHNFTDDFTYTIGNHTVQFGGNVRLIRSRRSDSSRAYDNAVINPSFYGSSGRVLDRPITSAGYTIAAGQRSAVQNSVASILGRFSQYTGNFNYDLQGNVLPTGTPLERTFATEEYDTYVQDAWKVLPNLTVTGGLRYGLSRPVYEVNGYQVRPDKSLGEFLEQRAESAATGRPYNELINFELAGPKNNKKGFYSLDKNNFQPRIAVAYSPNFKGGIMKRLFGGESQSVIRGGFAITNDYFGQQLAVTFDQLSTLGFATEDTIAANTYNVTSNLGPRFTGFGQAIRNLPGITAPNRFQTPADEDQRIESSLDDTLVSPTHYSWNVSYGRQLPKGLYFEASYVGRKAKNLLATRDVLQLNNLVDPRSGTDWYTAAGILADLRERNTPISAVPRIPYFENLFPGIGATVVGDASLTPSQAVYTLVARESVDGFNILDWTYIQLLLDDESTVVGRNAFFHPQYAAFSAFSTVARSNYHGGLFTLRQRLGTQLTYDINYTFSKSLDNASGLQTSGTYGSAFILNALRPDDQYAASDFDVRHILNVNALWQIPIGRNRAFFSDMNPVLDAIVGGFQLTSIFRYNTGYPTATPFDAAQWATNWNAQSNGVRVRPIQSSPTRGENGGVPNLFSDPQEAYRSFRNARAGESGDRNVLRLPSYVTLDLGLSKNFKMPYGEDHNLELRFEVFNVANTQRFTINNVTRETFGLDIDPGLGTATPVFGNFDSIQGQPRRVQFGIRYSF